MAKITVHQDLEKVREELEQLDSSPIPHDELKARIAAEIGHGLASPGGYDSFLLRAMASPARGLGDCTFDDMFVIKNKADNEGMQNPGVLPIEIPLSLVLTWIFGAQRNTRINEKIDDLAYTPGPPMAERPARRAELVAKLHQLEQNQGEL